MSDWGGFLNKSCSLGGGSTNNEDFDEEDVWGVTKERDYLSTNIRVSKESSGSSSSSAWRIPTSPRNIPRANSNSNSNTNSNNITLPSSGSLSHTNVVQGSSAPMDIPDWSKIYGKKGSRDGSWVAVGEGVSNKGDCSYGDHYHVDCGGDDDEDEDEDEMIPPHEWIARKLARSQISSFSVCEGIGRTLKGRDLSKVRNAILTKTGFIE